MREIRKLNLLLSLHRARAGKKIMKNDYRIMTLTLLRAAAACERARKRFIV
jgi:hypothetical protein